MRSPVAKKLLPLRRLSNDTSGSVAIEFALIAPILAISLVAAFDLGFAVQEKMALDHAVRAGAQYAMSDPGTTAVMNVITHAAANNFPGSAGGASATIQTPVKFCACKTATGVTVSCTTMCSGAPASVYYRLSASKTYSPKSFLVPDLNMSSQALVQIR